MPDAVDADFCVAALEDAMNRSGVPKIFNTDPGSQFTSTSLRRRSMRPEHASQWMAEPLNG